jgi:hypothetical protein
MNGIHEVRGSIPLGSINQLNKLRAAKRLPSLFCPLIVT